MCLAASCLSTKGMRDNRKNRKIFGDIPRCPKHGISAPYDVWLVPCRSTHWTAFRHSRPSRMRRSTCSSSGCPPIQACLPSSKFKCQSRYPSDKAPLRCQVLCHALPGGGGNSTLHSLPPPPPPTSKALVLVRCRHLFGAHLSGACDIHRLFFQKYPYSFPLIPLITLNSN